LIRRIAGAAVAAFAITVSAIAQQTPSSADITFLRTFLLRNISGTAANPGDSPHNALLYEGERWRVFREDLTFLTYETQTGPANPEHKLFSTNWLAAGGQREVGENGLLLLRARVSLEAASVPDDGYPMLLQSAPGAGGPDRQPGHDFAGELAAHFASRLGGTSFLHLYAAPVGDPAFGSVPFAQRASAREFAAAPFSYAAQELTHHETGVVTAGYANHFFGLEGSAFHDTPPESGDFKIHFGGLDAWSARATITPAANWSLQVSSASNRNDRSAKRQSASISYGNTWRTGDFNVSAIWGKDDRFTGDALLFEATLRLSKNYFLARFESVKDSTHPFVVGGKRIGSGQIGYTRDLFARPGSRVGIGALIDYHTQTHELSAVYGHKPQDVYFFIRTRTDPFRRQ
jgi:hypothetical protein